MRLAPSLSRLKPRPSISPGGPTSTCPTTCARAAACSTYPGLRDGKAELVQGRWPGVAGDGGYDDTTGDTDGIVVEIVVDSLGLEFLDLELGEGFEIVPATGGDNQPSTRVVVVGVIEPVDLEDEYWYRRHKLLAYQDDDWTLVPLFTSEQALRQQIGRRYPGIYTSSAWFVQIDREGHPRQTRG